MSAIRNIWIIAGEASGDLYGAALAQELRQIAAARGDELRISGMGGEKMRSADIDIRVDSSELGVIGVIEVLRNIFTFVAIYFKLLFAARRERPGAVVLIDYPGFNLALALALKLSRIKVVWYVCPHLWVWGKWRLPVLARICSKMLVIFPFEVEVFAKTKLNAEFVGHPLLDIVEARRDPGIKRNPDDFLLLPGSRTMEITRLLIPMLETAALLKNRHPDLVFHLSAPREKIAKLCQKLYDQYREDHTGIPPISITSGDTGYWLQRAGTGLASSGTVTVESAIAGLPLVVGYRLNWVTILLASLVVRLYRGFFTMVNIIANREVFEEFLQHHFAPKELVPATERILPGGSRREEVEAGMAEVKQLLSPRSASAARQAAEACYTALTGE